MSMDLNQSIESTNGEQKASFEELANWASDDGGEIRNEVVRQIRAVLNHAEVKKYVFQLAVSRRRIKHIATLFTRVAAVEERLFDPQFIAVANTKELFQLYETLMYAISAHTTALQAKGKSIAEIDLSALLVEAEGLKQASDDKDLPPDSKERLRNIVQLVTSRSGLGAAVPKQPPAVPGRTMQPVAPPPMS